MSENKIMEKIPLKYVDGFPLPEPMFSEKRYREIFSFKPDDTDIILSTYPKCGTTWTMYIVWEILHKGIPPPPPYILMMEEMPFLEFTGIETISNMKSPRVMKTHLPFDLNPYNSYTKYIYVYRNPWDCCVSFFYHERDMEPEYDSLTFDNFFECFLKGEVPWGDYFDHFLSWYKHRDDSNILYLKYEDMKKDSKATILQIAEFLGEEYLEMLKEDDELMDKILQYTSFKYMKESLPIYTPLNMKEFEGFSVVEMARILSKEDKEKVKKVEFFRKGQVGDWRNHFSENQKLRFRERIVEKLKGSPVENTIMEEWRNMR